MKFPLNEIVIYNDDGQFPSLDGKECKVIGYDKHLGWKALTVEFVLGTGKKFVYNFNIKRFKKVKKK